MANSAWSILVGVDFDTSNLKRKLNQTLSEFNSKSKIKLDASDIENAALTFNVANQIFRTSIEIIESLVQQVYELDSALIEFQKVSDLSGTSLDNYVAKLSDMGKSVGRTTSEMVEATTEFRKNGFNNEDAAQLGVIASMYQNVSDEAISASDSASFIISQMIAFGIEAENAEHIIDAVNEVSNTYSVSSAQLATNLGNMSAVMSQTGASFEESLGMLTAITEVTRNASKASRGLVSIGSRLIQITDENSSIGKTLKETYEGLGIVLFDDNQQLLSSYEIFTQLAEIWPTLDRNTQNFIASNQAGTNQFQNFSALMSNFAHATEATGTALNSTGSAAEENSKFMEGLEAK